MHGKTRPPRPSFPPPRDALTFDYEIDDEAKVRGKDGEQKKNQSATVQPILGAIARRRPGGL